MDTKSDFLLQVKEEVSKMTEDVAEKRMTANDTIVRKMKLEIAALENSNMKLTAAVHNNCLGISFKEYEIRRAKEEMALLDQRLCDIQTETEALKVRLKKLFYCNGFPFWFNHH